MTTARVAAKLFDSTNGFARLRLRAFFTALPLAVALLFGVGVTVAQADLSKLVIAAFKGKIVVSQVFRGGHRPKASR